MTIPSAQSHPYSSWIYKLYSAWKGMEIYNCSFMFAALIILKCKPSLNLCFNNFEREIFSSNAFHMSKGIFSDFCICSSIRNNILKNVQNQSSGRGGGKGLFCSVSSKCL